jgi:hypothetical protein
MELAMSAIGNGPKVKFNWDVEAFQEEMASKYKSTIDDNSPADGICIKTSNTKEKACRVVEKKLHSVPFPNETKKDEIGNGLCYLSGNFPVKSIQP